MEVGGLVALLVEKYNERPQIGKGGEERHGQSRYDGKWNGKWKILGRKGRLEDVDTTAIVYSNIC